MSAGAVTRRGWLAGLFRQAGRVAAEVAADELDHRFPKRRRPPGAVDEPEFLALCDRCGDCMRACPYGAISIYTEAAGLVAGTPVMLPDQRPCRMCEGFPCAAACEQGALAEPASKTWSLGAVELRTERCIAYAGPECGACVDLCPGEQAISLERWRPRLEAERCVGCGLCIEACPTSPPAIELSAIE